MRQKQRARALTAAPNNQNGQWQCCMLLPSFGVKDYIQRYHQDQIGLVCRYGYIGSDGRKGDLSGGRQFMEAREAVDAKIRRYRKYSDTEIHRYTDTPIPTGWRGGGGVVGRDSSAWHAEKGSFAQNQQPKPSPNDEGACHGVPPRTGSYGSPLALSAASFRDVGCGAFHEPPFHFEEQGPMRSQSRRQVW